MQAQTDMMVAQANAAAMQNLPSLPCYTLYTGEGANAADDGFDRWIERFHKRAEFARWSAKEKIYQLKLHLARTTLDVFCMQPEGEMRPSTVPFVSWRSNLHQ